MSLTRSFAAALLVGLSGQFAGAAETPLERYVREPDPAYSWKVVNTTKSEAGTAAVIHLTSQRWLTEKEVDRPLWEHWLTVVRPAKVEHKTAFLMIGGGSNGGEAPSGPSATLIQIAQATNSVVAELKMVPNQPLTFHGDGVPRKEDNLIGYGWDQFLKTGDAKWLARLPMVKSAVKAMDCIQEYTASEEGGGNKIEKFVVAGGSKRGWTTWMTGTADERVSAIVPIVIDVVNVDESMRNHVAAYGFWSLAVGDYYKHGIMRRWGDSRLDELYKIVDPYHHLDKLTMPKYVVNASGDQFFTPDSSRFYYGDLKGPKVLRYVPNADHSLRGSDAVSGIIAFYHAHLNGKELPSYSWTFADDGTIRVVTKDKPEKVTLWVANNPEARDFRVDTIGKAYKAHPVESGANEDGEQEYVAKVPNSEKGWTASFVELTFNVGAPVPLKVTTAVRITPDELPHLKIRPDEAPYERDVK